MKIKKSFLLFVLALAGLCGVCMFGTQWYWNVHGNGPAEILRLDLAVTGTFGSLLVAFVSLVSALSAAEHGE
jgi:hypothetical protein